MAFDTQPLTAGRAGWLREVGLEPGALYLVSPTFEYDVILDRFFPSSSMRIKAVKTQFGYARDLGRVSGVLVVGAGQEGLAGCLEEGHLAQGFGVVA
ncbi:hypothetical protein ACIBO4_04325 [Streptomyces sp. NPDC050149]|uniref:hypothetical protein n=1 Tax=unclassified Streptomyces TaxID=2593676 RepID=UPI002E346222|nr:hypothetical protein [Streptomyces sp. NBC_01358]